MGEVGGVKGEDKTAIPWNIYVYISTMKMFLHAIQTLFDSSSSLSCDVMPCSSLRVPLEGGQRQPFY